MFLCGFLFTIFLSNFNEQINTILWFFMNFYSWKVCNYPNPVLQDNNLQLFLRYNKVIFIQKRCWNEFLVFCSFLTALPVCARLPEQQQIWTTKCSHVVFIGQYASIVFYNEQCIYTKIIGHFNNLWIESHNIYRYSYDSFQTLYVNLFNKHHKVCYPWTDKPTIRIQIFPFR